MQDKDIGRMMGTKIRKQRALDWNYELYITHVNDTVIDRLAMALSHPRFFSRTLVTLLYGRRMDTVWLFRDRGKILLPSPVANEVSVREKDRG
jgi:hypothetical protein